MKKYFILMVLLVLLFSIGIACGEEIGDNSTDLEVVESQIEVNDNSNNLEVVESEIEVDDNEDDLKVAESAIEVDYNDNSVQNESYDASYLSSSDESTLEESNEIIIVDNWDGLKKYALKSDKNYVVKLKENTNFYPKLLSSNSDQIVVKNNLTIIGSSGSYFGDISPNGEKIKYNAIVADMMNVGLRLENVTFKNINIAGIFITLSGNTFNSVKNCLFEDIITSTGHSCILHLEKGDATLDNCSFINCTNEFGCVSVYNAKSTTSARMILKNCYFENNFAQQEPGCINNCGIITVYNSTFIKNTATTWAGAIHTHSGANTTLHNCEFIDNVAGWNGGALYTYGNLQIYNTIFRGNNCTTNNGGGAIGACTYGSSPHIYIVNSTFEENENLCWALDELSTSGTGRGGAISFMDDGSLEVRNCTFIANAASIGSAICAIEAGSYGSPTVIIEGNTFINHNRKGDVLNIKTIGTPALVYNNNYINNSIEFDNITLIVSDPFDKKVNVSIYSKLKNPSYYDSDILNKCKYEVYVDGILKETINGTIFTLNFEDIETCKVYVKPSISSGSSEEITISVPREYIYVSKEKGNDSNNGFTPETPLYTLSKAIELAKLAENIILMDGTFNEEDLDVDYRLTIWGTNNSSISSTTINNSMFNIHNAKFSLRNMTIKNVESLNHQSKFIKGVSSRIFLENCLIESNTINTFIESPLIGISNTIFKNNNISLNSNEFNILNSTFYKNILNSNGLFYSNYDANDWNIKNSKFINNNGNVLIYYSSKSKELKIDNSIFDRNYGLNQASCFIIDDSAKLKITSSIIFNNDDKLPIIYKNTSSSQIIIDNSILLNNSNNINSIIDGNLNNTTCNYNWWGSTFENSAINPIKTLHLDNWLFLNINFPNDVEFGKMYTADFNLNYLMSSNISSIYSQCKLPTISLLLTTENITTDAGDSLELINGNGKISFLLNNLSNGLLSANYNIIKSEISFNFIKSDPTIIIHADDILIGEDEYIEIKLPNDAKGNITIQFDDIFQLKPLNNSVVFFNFTGLNVKTYDALITYSGDERYQSYEKHVNFSVKKYDSNIKIVVGEIIVYNDVIVTINAPEDATGTVTLIINNEETTLLLEHSNTYIINNITRGDWDIKAKYEGDSKYYSSEDEIIVPVAKYDASVIINLLDINYGEDAFMEIYMDNDATGNVTVIIDDKIKTEKLLNGKAKLVISNLTAGFKNVIVKYTGDSNYNEKTYSSIFYVDKIPTTFDINAIGDKEGKDTIVKLTISEGIEGNFTITIGKITETVIIPLSGEITWTTSKLSSGNYTVTVTYEGQNYKTCVKTTNVTVTSWKEPNWPNNGFDAKNTGKSPYESNTNGEIKWEIETEELLINNVAIDEEGNIYILTTNGIFAYDKNGVQLWNFTQYNPPFSGMVIGREIIALPLSGDTLYFINKTNGEKYGYSNIWQGSSIYTPIIDKKANIYISSEKNYETGCYSLTIVPYEIWEYGGQVIQIDLGKSSINYAPVMVNENIVCIGTDEGLKFVDISSQSVISIMNINTSVRPVVGDGDIIYTLTSNEIIAIDQTGNQIWKSNIDGGEAKYLAIDDENGFIYSINKQGNLYKYDILNSGVETLISDLNITSGLLIGNDGTLYVGSNSTFIAMDSNGKYLWKSNLSKAITGTPVMDEYGNIYVTGNTILFALTNSPLKEPELNINAPNVVYGNDVNIQVNISKEATGLVIIKINGQTYSCEINEGLVEISVPNLASGNYETNITYIGDKRYSTSQKSLTVNITKGKTQPENLIIPEINTSSPSFCINLPNDATGTLTISVDGVKYSSELTNGSATVNVPKLASGKHNIIITYSGDENYDSITTSKTVTVPSPKITNNKNIVMDYNDGSIYKVRVFGSDGKIIKGELVTFTINKKTIKVKTDKNGYASVKITEIPKKYTITATYKGINVKNTVTVKQILKAKNFKVKKTTKKLVLKATLKSSKGKTIKGKVIKFKFKGKTYKAKTNKKGIAKVTINKKVLKKLKAKKYALKITYLKNTINKTVTVKK